MFFQCLNCLNGDEGVDYAYQNRLEQYFLYSWEKNRNIAIESNEDLMGQLPTET
jgi:hypothetical protein